MEDTTTKKIKIKCTYCGYVQPWSKIKTVCSKCGMRYKNRVGNYRMYSHAEIPIIPSTEEQQEDDD